MRGEFGPKTLLLVLVAVMMLFCDRLWFHSNSLLLGCLFCFVLFSSYWLCQDPSNRIPSLYCPIKTFLSLLFISIYVVCFISHARLYTTTTTTIH